MSEALVEAIDTGSTWVPLRIASEMIDAIEASNHAIVSMFPHHKRKVPDGSIHFGVARYGLFGYHTNERKGFEWTDIVQASCLRMRKDLESYEPEADEVFVEFWIDFESLDEG